MTVVNPWMDGLAWQCGCVVEDPSATCICYPGECRNPGGCEPACPRCRGGVRKTNPATVLRCPACGTVQP